MYGHESTESLAERLAAKTAAFAKSGRRRIQADTDITELKVVLAVRAAVPGMGSTED